MNCGISWRATTTTTNASLKLTVKAYQKPSNFGSKDVVMTIFIQTYIYIYIYILVGWALVLNTSLCV
jgi:uncharacterized membrane protein